MIVHNKMMGCTLSSQLPPCRDWLNQGIELRRYTFYLMPACRIRWTEAAHSEVGDYPLMNECHG